LNSTSALCSFQCSAQVFLRPLATSSISGTAPSPPLRSWPRRRRCARR
jgi:hypothetical protein